MEALEGVIKEKRKSKSKRRSSFANEAFKLINMTISQNDEISSSQMIENLMNSQFEWISEQLTQLKERKKKANKIFTQSATVLHKLEEELNTKLAISNAATFNSNSNSNSTEKPKGYELLSKEHRDFLDSHDLNNDYLKSLLKELKTRQISKDIVQLNQNEKLIENKKFTFLNKNCKKRLSRCSRSSFAHPSFKLISNQNKSKDGLDPIMIAIEYFKEIEE